MQEPMPLLAFLHVAVDEGVVEATQHSCETDEPQGDAMHLALHHSFVLPDFHAEPAEDATPNGRANQRVNREHLEVHPDDSGGNADEMSHDWQEP